MLLSFNTRSVFEVASPAIPDGIGFLLRPGCAFVRLEGTARTHPPVENSDMTQANEEDAERWDGMA